MTLVGHCTWLGGLFLTCRHTAGAATALLAPCRPEILGMKEMCVVTLGDTNKR